MAAPVEFEAINADGQPPSSQTVEVARSARGHVVGLVTILTLAVAVLGYVREAALAARFGVSSTMDAYFGAIFIPTNLYLILVVGTVSPVLIPILLQRENGDRAGTSDNFSVVVNFVLVLFAGVVGCGMITARWWMAWLFPGFAQTTQAMALRLVYIVFPALPVLALSGVLTAALNGFHKYSLAAFAPALASLGVIVTALIARGPRAIYIVGIGTAVGFLLQCLVLVPATRSLGIRYRVTLNLRHQAIKRLFQLGGPLVLYLIVANVSLVLERNFASRLSAGALSSLTYAMRLFTVPSNFLAAPLAIVVYPYFAREALRPAYGELRSELGRAARFVLFLFAPVTAWIILNALPVTRVLYERGNFGNSDSLLVSSVLKVYAIGILPNAITVLLLRCFYAVGDTKTPLLAESIDLLFFIVCAPLLMRRFGIVGLAAARGLTFVLVATILFVVLWRRRCLLSVDRSLMKFGAQTLAATAGMALASWFALGFLQSLFEHSATIGRVEIVGAQMLFSSIVFLSLALVMKMQEPRKLLRTATTLLQTSFGGTFRI